MIQAETLTGSTSSDAAAFPRALRASGFEGEIAMDEATRLTMATDNSIYQVAPELVLFPATGADIVRVLETIGTKGFRDIGFTPRGGGTGTNGQSLGRSVVMDTSRHLNRILEIDPDGRRARVEPGVVLNQLNTALAGHGLFFPPHVSTASRATLGGMIGTDACGKGSARYGRTHDYVESLELVLADGRVLRLRSLTRDEVDSGDSPEAALARSLRERCAADPRAIAGAFPEMTRSLTGYNLRDAFGADGSVHLQHLVTGAEGTLGFVRQATLNLLPLPARRGMAVVRYASFDDALQDARELLATRPSAIETLDEHLFELARKDSDWFRVQQAMTGGTPPEKPLAVNFVEYEADDDAWLEGRLAGLDEALAASGRSIGHHVAADE
ncbi:FAD-binding oxidoreductase, partial [Ectothiorhodospiraceae bacterium WFHF3C12]|nr:FAD-binding oxidoreductase [Ectothiorhodospiraceae bacterium WFHF3C12]